MTSGFPKEPTPLFKAPAAAAFPIENRQGLHDQSLNVIFPKLNQILAKIRHDTLNADGFAFSDAPSSDKGKSRASDVEAFEELATWLSDWHLLVFLDTCGIFDLADMKLITRIAAKKDLADVDKLVKSPAWQTLVTIAREHAGE